MNSAPVTAISPRSGIPGAEFLQVADSLRGFPSTGVSAGATLTTFGSFTSHSTRPRVVAQAPRGLYMSGDLPVRWISGLTVPPSQSFIKSESGSDAFCSESLRGCPDVMHSTREGGLLRHVDAAHPTAVTGACPGCLTEPYDLNITVPKREG